MTELANKYAHLVHYAFGDSPELADHLVELVIAGKKTATCGAVDAFDDDDGEPFPEVGRQCVIVDGKGRPACIIETVDVAIRPFSAIDLDFVIAEGEGDLSLEYWRKGHREFFERNGGFSEDMLLACDRFKLVEILKRNEAA